MLCKPTESHWDKPCRLTVWQLVNVVRLLPEQRTHCRNPRLRAINPILAITPSNIYRISLSAVRGAYVMGAWWRPSSLRTAVSGAGEKSCFSLVWPPGLSAKFNTLTRNLLGANNNNAVIAHSEWWGWGLASMGDRSQQTHARKALFHPLSHQLPATDKMSCFSSFF